MIETKLVVYPTISPTLVLSLFSSFSGTTTFDPGKTLGYNLKNKKFLEFYLGKIYKS